MNLSKKKLQELNEKKTSVEDLDDRYFIDSQYRVEVENVLKLLNEKICSFKEIIDKVKSMENTGTYPYLHKLLRNEKFFEELTSNNLLNEADLRYLLNKIDGRLELGSLSENTILVNYLVDKVLFKELVDTFKSIRDRYNASCLKYLLWNKKLFQELFENNKLTKDDLKYVLSKIDNIDELYALCNNISLLKHTLNEFILNKENVDRLNTMIENYDWCKENNIHNIFDYLEHHNKIDQELLELIELNKKAYELICFELTETQQSEIIEILKNNDKAQNILIQIVENNLQDQYSYESLKNLLSKDDKKKKMKMNF